jgi:hypothetical protein
LAAKPVADTGHGDAEGHLAGGAGVGLGVLARFPCLAGDDGELLAVEVLGLVEGDEVAGEPAPVEVLRATHGWGGTVRHRLWQAGDGSPSVAGGPGRRRVSFITVVNRSAVLSV